MVYILIIAAVTILGFSGWAYFKGGWKIIHQRIVGGMVILYGMYLATLTGSYTALVLPGIGKIAIGFGSGAAVGFFSWLALGTIGVATGGTGFAVGAGLMTLVGGIFGLIGGASGGFGLQTVTYPLVSPIFWGPIIILGIYLFRGRKLKKLQFPALPPSSE